MNCAMQFGMGPIGFRNNDDICPIESGPQGDRPANATAGSGYK
jgi:hypothetical protein